MTVLSLADPSPTQRLLASLDAPEWLLVQGILPLGVSRRQASAWVDRVATALADEVDRVVLLSPLGARQGLCSAPFAAARRLEGLLVDSGQPYVILRSAPLRDTLHAQALRARGRALLTGDTRLPFPSPVSLRAALHRKLEQPLPSNGVAELRSKPLVLLSEMLRPVLTLRSSALRLRRPRRLAAISDWVTVGTTLSSTRVPS